MARPYAREIESFQKYLAGKIERGEADYLYEKILNEISVVSQTHDKPQIRHQNLLLYKDPQDSLLTWADTLRIIFAILRTRGLLR